MINKNVFRSIFAIKSKPKWWKLSCLCLNINVFFLRNWLSPQSQCWAEYDNQPAPELCEAVRQCQHGRQGHRELRVDQEIPGQTDGRHDSKGSLSHSFHCVMCYYYIKMGWTWFNLFRVCWLISSLCTLESFLSTHQSTPQLAFQDKGCQFCIICIMHVNVTWKMAT